MKHRFLIAFTLSLSMLLPLGCATATSPTPPLAPGYSNQADQTMGQVLAAGNAYYQRIQKDTVSGVYFPSPTEKSILNAVASALNIANQTYLAYHNGTATQAQAQTAIDLAQNRVSGAQAQIPGVK